MSAVDRVISGDNPGTRDGIFAKLHALGEHCGRTASTKISTVLVMNAAEAVQSALL
jgi:hypothetical protein